MKVLALLLLVASAALAASPFRFRDISPASVELIENGRPVYVYNHGMMRPHGVPADRYRCCYVHPLYSPEGVVVTDDFPKDHYHHRGVFWVWPVVEAGGKRYDLWLIQGIRKRFQQWTARAAGEDSARLAFINGWFTDDEHREVVRERVEIVAHPAVSSRRELDFALQFEALDRPVRINGKLDGKGYGGFCARLAPRRDTVIVTDTGKESGDSNLVPHAWAREEGAFASGRAALRIDIDPANPGFPNGWCLRYYGFLGVNFPGMDGYTLRPGHPLVLKYKVTVADLD